MFFLQAFQIDVDHWRHVYMLLGMVWGLEAARVTWVSRTGGAAATPAARWPARGLRAA
jgi:hypothetical protein